jgi:hypothetical protein
MGLGARLRFLLRADLKAIAEGRAHETHIRNQFEQKARVGEVLLLSLSPKPHTPPTSYQPAHWSPSRTPPLLDTKASCGSRSLSVPHNRGGAALTQSW